MQSSTNLFDITSNKRPQMQGNHGFNPKDASTLVIAEESPSFYNQSNKEDMIGMTNSRISLMLHRQPNDVTFDESRPSESQTVN